MSTPLPERAAVILAAGEGKRMKSDLPKVVHPIGGRPMIQHVVETALRVGFSRQVIVIGFGRDRVREALRDYDVQFAVQAEQLGTGHAVDMAAPLLDEFSGEVAVLCGDVPLLSEGTLRNLVRIHEEGGYAATVLTFHPRDPQGYGRIYRDPDGDVEKIVEQRDLAPGETHPTEVNSGTYCFAWPLLRPVLRRLNADNDQREYYLTDSIALLRGDGHRVGACVTSDPWEVEGVNDPRQLETLDAIWRERHRSSPEGSSR